MIHGTCDAGRIVRLDPFGDVLITKAADSRMVTTRVVIDQVDTRFKLPPRPSPGRHWLYIAVNEGADDLPPDTPVLYVGGRDVTPAPGGNGYPLLPQVTLILEVTDQVDVHGITDSFLPGTEIDVRVLELV
jgi:hypothetical protein